MPKEPILPPNYRAAHFEIKRCENCFYFRKVGSYCEKFNTKVDKDYTCDSWQPNRSFRQLAYSSIPEQLRTLRSILNMFKVPNEIMGLGMSEKLSSYLGPDGKPITTTSGIGNVINTSDNLETLKGKKRKAVQLKPNPLIPPVKTAQQQQTQQQQQPQRPDPRPQICSLLQQLKNIPGFNKYTLDETINSFGCGNNAAAMVANANTQGAQQTPPTQKAASLSLKSIFGIINNGNKEKKMIKTSEYAKKYCPTVMFLEEMIRNNSSILPKLGFLKSSAAPAGFAALLPALKGLGGGLLGLLKTIGPYIGFAAANTIVPEMINKISGGGNVADVQNMMSGLASVAGGLPAAANTYIQQLQQAGNNLAQQFLNNANQGQNVQNATPQSQPPQPAVQSSPQTAQAQLNQQPMAVQASSYIDGMNIVDKIIPYFRYKAINLLDKFAQLGQAGSNVANSSSSQPMSTLNNPAAMSNMPTQNVPTSMPRTNKQQANLSNNNSILNNVQQPIPNSNTLIPNQEQLTNDANVDTANNSILGPSLPTSIY